MTKLKKKNKSQGTRTSCLQPYTDNIPYYVIYSTIHISSIQFVLVKLHLYLYTL